MVAPHETGALVRSLVRVPGSGSDRNAGSDCLDLARVSTLAAAIPVPKTLPAALASAKAPPKPLESRNEKLIGKTAPVSGDGDRKRSLESSPVSMTKRTRLVYMTPEQVMNNANRIVTMSTASGPVLFMPLQAPSPSTSQPSVSEATITQLVQERNNLMQENQMLQRQLLLFQQLFKDKKRLGSVVKRLGVQIP
ncbi:hypothetical protein SK128_024287 [Halocaridina rubra]|uniref:Uncharacterized protein n=1 Tax=Halocaridina rubra TaxID=373956 RepID=A0AAN8WTG0_HALRR